MLESLVRKFICITLKFTTAVNLQIQQETQLAQYSRELCFQNCNICIKRCGLQADDQIPCHMTHTNEGVHKIIMETLHLNKHVKEETSGPLYVKGYKIDLIFFDFFHFQTVSPQTVFLCFVVTV